MPPQQRYALYITRPGHPGIPLFSFVARGRHKAVKKAVRRCVHRAGVINVNLMTGGDVDLRVVDKEQAAECLYR